MIIQLQKTEFERTPELYGIKKIVRRKYIEVLSFVIAECDLIVRTGQGETKKIKLGTNQDYNRVVLHNYDKQEVVLEVNWEYENGVG